MIDHLNIYIQDNQLYDADTHELNQFDDGILHYVQVAVDTEFRWEECHGQHMFIDTEVTALYGLTMLIDSKQRALPHVVSESLSAKELAMFETFIGARLQEINR